MLKKVKISCCAITEAYYNENNGRSASTVFPLSEVGR